jgi:hypothetical protein
MSVTGSFKDLYLSEIFQFIEQRHKSGLLSFRRLPVSQSSKSRVHYIWVHHGCLVAAANRLDYQGLVTLIEAHQWVGERVLDKLLHWCCPLNKPLGLYLKNEGVLQTQQLKQLFNIQILQQVCALFQLKDGIFKYNSTNLPSDRIKHTRTIDLRYCYARRRWLSADFWRESTTRESAIF